MKVVGAGLHGDINGAAGRIALLRIEDVRLDFEFLDRVGRGRKAYGKVEGIVRRSIQSDLVLRRRAIDTKRGEIAVRDRRREHRVAGVHNTGRQGRKLISSAFRQRKLCNLPPLDDSAGGYGTRLQGSARRDGHGLGNAARLELHIKRQLVGHANLNLLIRFGLETFFADQHLVLAGL